MKQQRGVALLTVLLVLALTVSAIAVIGLQTQLGIKRSSLLMREAQARSEALSVERYVALYLRFDAFSSDNDHLKERWAQQNLSFLLLKGDIDLRISDLSGRFNLTSLYQEPFGESAQAFLRLCRLLSVPQEQGQKVIDWLDSRQAQEGLRGARPVVLSDLLMIPDFKRESFFKLLPYVEIYPYPNAYNVNTLHPLLWSALVKDISPAEGERLALRLFNQPLDQYSIWSDNSPLAHYSLKHELFSTGSSYFLIQIRVELEGAVVRLRTIMQRSGDSHPRVLRRQYWDWYE